MWSREARRGARPGDRRSEPTLARQSELRAKDRLLHVPGREVVVVVQSDLADRPRRRQGVQPGCDQPCSRLRLAGEEMRVVRMDGAPLRFADALVRGLASIFSLAVFGLGGLWILKDPERQAWHDRIAGTYVVKVPRNWPI